MSFKAKVRELWPEADAEPDRVNGRQCIKVTVTRGRYAYGLSYSAAWREAYHMVLYSSELRKGAAGGSAASPAPGAET